MDTHVDECRTRRIKRDTVKWNAPEEAVISVFENKILPFWEKFDLEKQLSTLIVTSTQ
jgi:uridine kinase